MKKLDSLFFEFLSSISHPHVCLVIVSSWGSSLHCVGINILR